MVHANPAGCELLAGVGVSSPGALHSRHGAKAVGMALKSKSGGLERFLADAQKRAAESVSVQVGFFEGAAYPDGTPVAAVAAYNEFGTDKSPPRPFFRNTIAERSPGWSKLVAAALKASDGNLAATAGIVGAQIEEEVKETISNFTDPPNAPSTIARKKSEKPLVDKGDMLQSVSHEVKS